MAGGMKVPVTVDKEDASRQLNSWLADQNDKEIRIGVDPSPFRDLAEETKNIGRAFDDLKVSPSLAELTKRAEDADDAFERARREAETFALSLRSLGQDADPAWIDAYKARLRELNTNLAQAQRTSSSASAAIVQHNEELKNNLSYARGWIGDFGDAFDKVGQTFLHLSDAQTKAGSSAIYMAQKGIALTEGLGVEAQVLGGLAGVTLSLFTSGMEAAARATQKQVDAALKDLNAKRQQADLTRKATEAIINYQTALAAAGKVEIGNVLTLLTAEKNLFDERTKYNREQLKQVEDYRTKELAKAKENATAEGTLATQKRVTEVNAYADKFKLLNEEAIKYQEQESQARVQQIATYAGTQAIEEQIAALDKNRKALDDIGKVKSIRELKSDYNDAKTATDEAITAVKNLKDEIAVKEASGEGGFLGTFQTFYDKLVTLPRLVEEAEKAIGLEGGAKTDLTTKQKEGGLTEAQKAWQRDQEFRQGILDVDRAYEDEQRANEQAFLDDVARIDKEYKDKDIQDTYDWNVAQENAEIEKNQRIHDETIAANAALSDLKEKQRQEDLKRAQEQAAKEKELFEQTAQDYEDSINTIFMPAVTAVTGQLYENIEAGKSAFDGFGNAVKKGISESLKALGKQFAVKAIGEAAEGAASLAFQDYPGAGKHFAAAAGFSAAALAAGIGGALVASKIPKEEAVSGPAPSSNAGGFSGGPLNQGRTPFTTDVKAPLVINVSGVPFGALTLRELTAIGGRVNAAQDAYHTNGSIPE